MFGLTEVPQALEQLDNGALGKTVINAG